MAEKSRLVYSTDGEHVTGNAAPRAPKPAARPSRAAPARNAPPDDGVVRIRREKQGRSGKTVTTVSGIPGVEADLEALLKTLKQLCGAGGSRRSNAIEIQGDHRERIQAKLEQLGHRVKLAGG